ncbi:unnamed protein product, partial [Brassica napus]
FFFKKFLVKKLPLEHIESKYDVQLKENESYSSLVATVKEKYRLDQFLLPTEHVLLTYELPDWMKETDEYTSPPLEIKDDRDVEVFMAVRVDCVWLELYVTYGDADVSRYRRLTAMEEGLILIANPRPGQQPLTRWRDSSRPPDTDDDPPATGGVIRLREVTDTFNKGDCSMVDKGKAIMTQDSVASVRNIVGQGEGNSLGGGLGPNSGTLASMNRCEVAILNFFNMAEGSDLQANDHLRVGQEWQRMVGWSFE